MQARGANLAHSRCNGVSRPQAHVHAAPKQLLRVSGRQSRASTVLVQAAKREYEVVRELLPADKVSLTITVPGSICQEGFTETVKIMRRDVVGPLKGFRQDKIPLSEIISRVGGQAQFDAAVLETVLIRAMGDVMPVHAARMLPGSEQIATNMPQLMAAFDPAKPLTFQVTYSRLPEVQWSSPYQDIVITLQDSGNIESDQAAADGLIRQYLKQEGQKRVVADRGLARGDGAIINMRIAPKSNPAAPYPGLEKEKFFFDTDADMLDLTDHMLGMLPGEQRSWEFVFPQDWHVDLWRGQTAVADIKLEELFSYILPEFNDEFVAQHYPQFESAADLRQSLVSTTSLERMRDIEDRVKDAILTQVSACVASPIPEALLQAQGEKEFQAKLLDLVQRGVARMEDVERQLTQEGLDAFIESERMGLEERCRYVLAAEAIAEEQGIDVDIEGLEEEVERAKAQCKAEKVDFDPDVYRQETVEKLRYAAVMQWLQQNLKVEVLPWGGEGAAEQAAATQAAQPASV
ncbi:hypothetical protein OEZ85_002177 [Tetradesmus obliquus]|uniref:peptidylprolyl isomerase n=1 Tax=Tetradesmus obliquus TaxID=3088 RepID=A0ABY8U362_TETOB|nr:hypothetical protein OEZ85_002177 [Tetradesmus obliquus]